MEVTNAIVCKVEGMEKSRSVQPRGSGVHRCIRCWLFGEWLVRVPYPESENLSRESSTTSTVGQDKL
jgi:hypothetical protein